jgi:crotonobetainyl-CoA:carnitine CoA-transferase CaiB-like acyl-CoA transferase
MPMLSNLTVLSLEQATTLPFLTQRLAREGARVVRLEVPRRGDPNRYVGRDVLGEPAMASYFLPNNCGKQSITLNLACAEGRDLLKRLVCELQVDIFATNNRPSSYARLGIDYATLSDAQPGLIWLGITGFGPEQDAPAYDPVLQARAGWMALTGEPGGQPLVFGLPMADLGAAEHAYGALMRALYQRALTGQGSRLDISMLYSAATWMASPFMLAGLGERTTRRGNTHQFFAPAAVFPTRDGHTYVAIGNDSQWAALARLPGFEALDDPAYACNAGRIADVARLNERLGECTSRLATSELITALHSIGVPAARINTLDDVLGDPLLLAAVARARDARSGREVVLPPLPVCGLDDVRELAFPPRLGEHNTEIFSEALGYSSAQLARWQQGGVI